MYKDSSYSTNIACFISPVCFLSCIIIQTYCNSAFVPHPPQGHSLRYKHMSISYQIESHVVQRPGLMSVVLLETAGISAPHTCP
jgi:hypothetical protein